MKNGEVLGHKGASKRFPNVGFVYKRKGDIYRLNLGFLRCQVR
jgi:hypothetical protein